MATFNGNDQAPSTLTGGSEDDVLIAGRQADVLTGAGGRDAFVFRNVPWSASHVTDFTLGADRLDMSQILTAAGYAGSDPIADGYVSLLQQGGATWVMFDADASGTAVQWPSRITVLDNFSASGVTWAQLTGATAADPAPTLTFSPTQLESSEAYLPGGGASDPARLSPTGTLKIDSPDGVASIEVGGRSVFANAAFTPITLTTAHGQELNVTGYDAATKVLSFNFTFKTAVSQSPASGDAVNVAVTDGDGDTTSGSIVGVLFDTQPSPRADAVSVPQGNGTTVQGNVTANDAGLADNAWVYGVTTPAGTVYTTGSTGSATAPGSYGSLTVQRDGAFSYTASAGAPAGGQDIFGYIVTDTDWVPVHGAAGNGAQITFTVEGSSGGVVRSGVDAGPTSLEGGPGDDRLIAGHQADTLTGRGGADVFAFSAIPWSAGRVTDFTVGTDRLDLSAIFQASGYSGSDPVADGHVSFQQNGTDTWVWFDADGAGGGYPALITKLVNTPASALTWSQVSGGPSSGGGDAQPTISNQQNANPSESNLPRGSSPTDWALTIARTATITSPDGIAEIRLGDQTVFANGSFTPATITTTLGQRLTATAFDASSGLLSYSYTLVGPVAHTSRTILDSGPYLTVVDKDGDQAVGYITAVIEDDEPSGRDDSATVAAGNSAFVTGNVLANDRGLSDGAAVLRVGYEGTPPTYFGSNSSLRIGGQFGVLALNRDGTYSYEPNSSAPAGSVDRFSYSPDDNDAINSPTPGNNLITFTVSSSPPPPQASLRFVDGAVSMAEGDSGTAMMQFKVQIGDPNYRSGVSGTYVVSAGSGAHPASTDDFSTDSWYSGSVSVPPGQTATAVVPIRGDLVVESDETFTVTLYVDGRATGSATGTILNDDSPSSGGASYTGNDSAPSTLTGGPGNDTLTAAHRADVLTGAGGADRFVISVLPWSPGHVTDFTPGTDVLDLRPVFQAAGYSGSNPTADGTLSFLSNGQGDTRVYLDVDGSGGQWPYLLTTLDHISPSQIGGADWLFH